MFSLTEYKVGSKIMVLFAVTFLVYGFFLYNKIETIATDIFIVEYSQ